MRTMTHGIVPNEFESPALYPRAASWESLPTPHMSDVPLIGECAYCPGRYLAYQSGTNARGRPAFRCEECRAALECQRGELPQPKPVARETGRAEQKRKARA